MESSSIYLVLGGARSGKSSFAEKIAGSSGLEVVYLATSEIRDHEMLLRVKKHREQRPKNWQTVEEPLHPEKVISEILKPSRIILLDCMTLWISNLLLHPDLPNRKAGVEEKERYILDKVKTMLALLKTSGSPAILVSNEVGYGIVPDNPLARTYRDIAGRVNQLCARYAKEVFLVIAGIPVELKSLSIDSLAFWQRSVNNER